MSYNEVIEIGTRIRLECVGMPYEVEYEIPEDRWLKTHKRTLLDERRERGERRKRAKE
jgi:hypothetical protein